MQGAFKNQTFTFYDHSITTNPFLCQPPFFTPPLPYNLPSITTNPFLRQPPPSPSPTLKCSFPSITIYTCLRQPPPSSPPLPNNFPSINTNPFLRQPPCLTPPYNLPSITAYPSLRQSPPFLHPHRHCGSICVRYLFTSHVLNSCLKYEIIIFLFISKDGSILHSSR